MPGYSNLQSAGGASSSLTIDSTTVTGGDAGDVLFVSATGKISQNDAIYQSSGQLSAPPLGVAVSGTTKTLALSDANTLQNCSNASAQTVTIPTNASVAFATGTVIMFQQTGAGQLTLTGAGGVTVNGTVAGSVSSAGQYNSVYIQKTATNTWVAISGNPSGGAASFTSLTLTSFLTLARTAVSDAAYAVLTTDCIVGYTALTAARTATLPTAASVTGKMYIIKDEIGLANTYNITLATTSSQKIDGASTKVISTNYGSVSLYSDGSNWNTF